MKVICIIQARMGSTRLPGKVLKEICGKTVLEHDIDRVRRVENIDKIVIATTTEKKDDVIVEEAKRLNVSYFRGSEDDVLSRYYNAAKENEADAVVRITSDCPLIDSEVSQNIIDFYMENCDKYDFISNTLERTYPRGLDTEVFSFRALEKAYNDAVRKSDREHVTPYIWGNPRFFSFCQYKNNVDYSELRWTLDTTEDFEFINSVYNYLYHEKKYFNMEDIIDLIEEHPELKHINERVMQKQM